jgi:hypothetical protein
MALRPNVAVLRICPAVASWRGTSNTPDVRPVRWLLRSRNNTVIPRQYQGHNMSKLEVTCAVERRAYKTLPTQWRLLIVPHLPISNLPLMPPNLQSSGPSHTALFEPKQKVNISRKRLKRSNKCHGADSYSRTWSFCKSNNVSLFMKPELTATLTFNKDIFS